MTKESENPTISLPALRFGDSAQPIAIDERVIVERLFRIMLNGEEYAAASILPGMEREFVYGFLYTSGAISRAEDVTDLQIAGDGAAAFVSTDGKTFDEYLYKARLPLTPGTACGAEPQAISTAGLPALVSDLRVRPSDILDALKTVRAESALFRETGGVHSVALFDSDGRLVARADDVGRHNAFDKIAGACLLCKLNPSALFAVTTGRLSSEIVGKCWRLGVPLLVSPSCATSRAIEIAALANIALCGFARGRRLAVYSADWRIGGRE
ncbi:MAG: formate dehydrogenase accessory sulfurtransferase FdhD [bacterium]